MIYKIYCLKDPISKEIRYIGATTKKLSERFSHHKYFALTANGQTYLAKWFRRIYKKYSILPIIEQIDECEEKDWEEREIYWISFYPKLTNIRKGGRGIIVDRSKDSITRSSEAKFIKVCQFDLKGNFIKTWNSIKEASNFFKCFSDSALSNAIYNSSGTKTFKGYYWMHETDFKNFGFNKSKKKIFPKEIFIFDKNMIFIKKFNSISETARYLEVYTSGIKQALDKFKKNGNPKTCKSYIIKSNYYKDIV